MILKRIVDAAMYVLLLLLMGQCVLRGAAHEWLGIAIGILFVLHNVLNRRWYKNLLKGKYTALRMLQTIINFLLIGSVLGCMLSGVLVSQHIFSVGSGGSIELGRHLHLVTSAWAFVLMTVHLGLHWPIFTAIGKKIPVYKKQVLALCRILAMVLCVYGLYQLLERRFWEELFHLIDYQKEYDLSQTIPAYLLGTASMSVFFTAAGYRVKCFLQKRTK